MGMSVLHIKSEIECKVILFDEEKGVATPNKYFNLEVRKGDQDLLFVATRNEAIRLSMKYNIEDGDSDYQLVIDEHMFQTVEQSIIPEEEPIISTQRATKEEMANGVEDDLGVVYSKDGLHLLSAKKCKNDHYVVRKGCKVIRDYAFYCCKNLQSVALSEDVTHIGNYAFENCTKITDMPWSHNLVYIGYGAFRNCEKLFYVHLPNSLKVIGDAAFSNTSIGFVNIERPANWNDTPDFTANEGFLIDVKKKRLIAAFVRYYYVDYNEIDCEHTDGEIVLPDGLTHIGDEAFCTSLRYCFKVRLPDSITHIGCKAFSNCQNLSKIVFPENLTYLGERACAFCDNLTSIVLPDNLKYIGNGAFMFCKNLSNIEIRSSLSAGWYVNENGFYHWLSSNGQCYSNPLPTQLEYIGDSAFEYCAELHDIALPYVKHIGEGAFSNSGIKVECAHSPLSDFYKEYVFINGCLIDTNEKKLLAYFPNKGDDLKEIILPDNIECIGHDAFHSCSNITKITIEKGPICIGKNAFSYCRNLVSVNLPEGMTTIGENAFCGCSKLSSITLPTSITNIGKDFLKETNSLILIPRGTKNHFISLLPDELHDRLSEIDGVM